MQDAGLGRDLGLWMNHSPASLAIIETGVRKKNRHWYLPNFMKQINMLDGFDTSKFG